MLLNFHNNFLHLIAAYFEIKEGIQSKSPHHQQHHQINTKYDVGSNRAWDHSIDDAQQQDCCEQDNPYFQCRVIRGPLFVFLWRIVRDTVEKYLIHCF